MAEIAIYHPDVERGGGAEAVCLHILEALSSEHDVTLLTGRRPDLSRLDDRYGTCTAGTDIELLGPVVKRLVDDMRFYRIRHAVYARAARRRADAYDGVVSAFNELTVPGGALQYVHHPLFRCPSSPEQDTKPFGRTYDAIARAIAKFEPTHGHMVTNSEWMASVLESCRGVRPEVVYPPVSVSDVSGRPWDERENGFVAVGRIALDKQTDLAIDIVEGLRQRGHDLSLHLVGAVSDTQYAADVQRRAESLDFVTLHGSIPRDDLNALLGSVRYGLHTKRYEHFGMAVAEMVAAGMLPFVPASGGQVEIVGNIDDLMYSAPEDAIEKIESVLQSHDQQQRLLESLPDPESRYSRDRFASEIRAQTNAWLESKVQ